MFGEAYKKLTGSDAPAPSAPKTSKVFRAPKTPRAPGMGNIRVNKPVSEWQIGGTTGDVTQFAKGERGGGKNVGVKSPITEWQFGGTAKDWAERDKKIHTGALERAGAWWDKEVKGPWDRMRSAYGRGSEQDFGSITHGVGAGGGFGTGGGFGYEGGGLDRYSRLTRQRQGLADALKARAMGTAPSLAGQQAKQAQDRGLAQSMALAMSQPSSALGRRATMQQQAMGNQAIARDVANARLAEMQQSQAAYGNVLGGMAGTQSQRDIAAMQDKRARDIAVMQANIEEAKLNRELQMKRDLARAQMDRQILGAGMEGVGKGIQYWVDSKSDAPDGAGEGGV